MRSIKRKLGEKFTDDYMELKLYYKSQMNIFKHLKKVKKRPNPDGEPGSTSFNDAGIYNGLTWVLLCLGTAMKFDKETKATTLYSYF